MEYIEISWDEEEECYRYECPFCGAVLTLPDDCWCDHVIYGYEEVNSQPLTPAPRWVPDFLKTKPIDYLDGLFELWKTDFAPSEDEELSQEELAQRKANAVEEYNDYWLTPDDFLTILGEPEFADVRRRLVVATLEDPFVGDTSYFLLNDEESDPQQNEGTRP